MAALNAPKRSRKRTPAPARGEWKPAPGVGWQHGAIPAPPDGISAATRWAWDTWMRAWFASHWTPDDLPALHKVARLYDDHERGEHVGSEMRLLMDGYGITPKGQQDRRWVPPEEQQQPTTDGPSPYSHLRSIS